MYRLNLPKFEPKIKREEQGLSIFDMLRRKYVALTPEEWVRQHFVNFLIEKKDYSPSLMTNEAGIKLNGVSRRCDTVVYNRSLTPVAIIEYKNPDIAITQDVFDQIARYNIVLKVKYLIVSNGISHYCCKMDYDNLTYSYLSEIPNFEEIV